MELFELANISIDNFLNYKDHSFQINFGEAYQLKAELIEVIPLQYETPTGRKPFIITFETEQKNEYFEQAIYNVQHPELGIMPMFLCPKGLGVTGMKYEAVFS